jgi:hypothetical protein
MQRGAATADAKDYAADSPTADASQPGIGLIDKRQLPEMSIILR